MPVLTGEGNQPDKRQALSNLHQSVQACDHHRLQAKQPDSAFDVSSHWRDAIENQLNRGRAKPKANRKTNNQSINETQWLESLNQANLKGRFSNRDQEAKDFTQNTIKLLAI